MAKPSPAIRSLTALRVKHGRDRSLARSFPDLSITHNVAPLGNRFAPTQGKRQLPTDAKQFPIGHQHKQGYELITPGMDLRWMSGRKT